MAATTGLVNPAKTQMNTHQPKNASVRLRRKWRIVLLPVEQILTVYTPVLTPLTRKRSGAHVVKNALKVAPAKIVSIVSHAKKLVLIYKITRIL